MSAVTPMVPPLETPGRVTFARVLRSEWTKLRSVRSTAWCLAITIVVTIGIPLLVAFAARSNRQSGDQGGPPNGFDIALIGVVFAQLVIGILGVLVITPEYSTGSIRSTFTAVPKRLPVLWSKIIDFAVVSIVVLVPAVLVSFYVTQAIVGGIPEYHLSLSMSIVQRCVFLAPVYVMLVGTFALALGSIIRNTAGGISVFVALFFVVPPIMLALPQSWQNAVSPYLPSNAGTEMFTATRGANTLSPLSGGLLFVGYCVIIVAVSAVLLRRRDV